MSDKRNCCNRIVGIYAAIITAVSESIVICWGLSGMHGGGRRAAILPGSVSCRTGVGVAMVWPRMDIIVTEL